MFYVFLILNEWSAVTRVQKIDTDRSCGIHLSNLKSEIPWREEKIRLYVQQIFVSF